MNIYYYGGTFDPPHIGHKMIVDHFYEIPDIMFIVPTYKSPLKDYSAFFSYDQRVKMLGLMFSSYKKIKILNTENNSASVYTCDTIKYLTNMYKKSKINLIIGADQLTNFSNWKNHQYIIDNCKIIVISRPGCSIDDSKYKFKLCNEINMAISSSEIRKNISDLSLIRTKLDVNIYDYIIKNKLYR